MMTVKLASLLLVLLLAACTVGTPEQAINCIPGDPGGSPACQQITYSMAR